MPTVYTRNGQIVGLPVKPLMGGSGGEGMVYVLLGDSLRCAKLYHAHKLDAERRRKIAYLVANPPALLANAAFRLCWPTDTLHDAQGQIVGFLMPRAFPDSVLLYELATTSVRKKLGGAWAIKFTRAAEAGRVARMKVCANLCIAVHCLHTSGAYLLVDFKPQNVMVSPSGEISLIDLDAVQVVAADGKVLFHGQVLTPEYAPAHPASFGVANGRVDASWDLFGLAVVLYEVWCGIHPFLTTEEGQYADCTIAESIQHGLFRFGPKENYLTGQQPPPHDGFRLLPDALRSLFQRALGNASLHFAGRPSAEEWAKALNATLAQGTNPMGRPIRSVASATQPAIPAAATRQDVLASDTPRTPGSVATASTTAVKLPFPTSTAIPKNARGKMIGAGLLAFLLLVGWWTDGGPLKKTVPFFLFGYTPQDVNVAWYNKQVHKQGALNPGTLVIILDSGAVNSAELTTHYQFYPTDDTIVGWIVKDSVEDVHLLYHRIWRWQEE